MNKSESLLEAAEAVVVRDGIARITLEAVAAEAGMSKGGLLHYFPSKEKLIEALVIRSAEQWRGACQAAYEKTEPGPGRMARALVQQCFGESDCWTDDMRSVGAAVFAALALDPKLIKPMRDVNREIREQILEEDGVPGHVGEALSYALDGFWLNWVLGINDASAEEQSRLHQALQEILRLVTDSSRHGDSA